MGYTEGRRGNEMRYTALEGIRIWLWDIQSGRRGYRGEVNTMNAVMVHRVGIREGTRQF